MIRSALITILFLGFCIACVNVPQNVAASPDVNSLNFKTLDTHAVNTTNGPAATTYYLSPTGNDSNSGTSASQAWATFNRAWPNLYPGDTLILLDGVYTQPLRPNTRGGQPGNPITVRAQNDGKAIIDGENQRETVVLQSYQNAVHFVIEGIVARNSSSSVYTVFASNNTFRRVSGYDANRDNNEHIFSIWGDNVLIEDCVASGTGRKMVMSYKGNNNTIRRCYAHWTKWDGRNFCNAWPWGDGIQIYIGDDNIIENSIVNGPVPGFGLSIQANGDPAETNVRRNQILGSAVLNAGMNEDSTVKEWGNTRPGPTECNEIRDFGWPAQRTGFAIWGPGETVDNLFQDILAWGNAGLGFAVEGVQIYENPTVNRATIANNGLGIWDGHIEGPPGNNIDRLDRLDISNSQIGGTSHDGEGARLTNRYVNGTLTDEALWPWPMEQRIRDELGISVTNLMAEIIPDQVEPLGGPVPTRLPPTVTPTPLPTATPVPVQAIEIPGRVEMESYHGYFDQSSGNLYASEAPNYRDDVDVRITADQGGGFKIGGIDPNEWLEFQVNIRQSGTYKLTARIASDDQAITKSFQVTIDEGSATQVGPMLVSPAYSAGWDTFIDVDSGKMELPAGTHTLKVLMNTGWFDINYLDFSLLQGDGVIATPQPTTQPTTQPTEDPIATQRPQLTPTAQPTQAPQPTGSLSPTPQSTGGSSEIPPSQTATPAPPSSYLLYLPTTN